MKRLFTAAAVWTTLGLASGLFYREFTRQRDFSGFTQLSVAHTHALALGTTILLVVLAVTKVFKLDADRRLRWFLLFWNVGLGLTFTMMLMKGSLQVLGAAFADSPMIAGISGLGHMTLTGSFVLFFLILRPALKADTLFEPATQPARS
ncbi:MAG: DUF2871 domain-containing protein [Propionibacteriaceae bacterium]|nr:DUF2871 domain-containing protein [Propionibacteriaceae bacterium]